MRRPLALFALALVLLPGVSSARSRPATRPGGERILWVAAHPDEELLVAPFLAMRCREAGALCAFVVATRGERGTCELPSCWPDLAAVRAAELDTAAAFLGAFVIRGSFADGSSWDPSEVLKNWGPELKPFLRTAIDAFQPDLIVTFDPRHGSTCHPDHRAIGRALLELGGDTPVAILTSRATVVGAWDAVAFDPGAGDATIMIDATAPLSRLRRTGWDVLVEIARIHRSQFPDRALDALAGVGPEARRIGLRVLPPDERLEGDLCVD